MTHLNAVCHLRCVTTHPENLSRAKEMDPLSTAIGVGLVVSLLFSELFGLAAGGMVVPGYFAMFLDRPLDVALTLAAALLTYWIVYAMSMVVIIFGKRRTVMMILVGYLVGTIIQTIPMESLIDISQTTDPSTGLPLAGFRPTELRVIGFIIPGLLAIWIDRQGLVETLSILITASVTVRLILIVLGVDLGTGVTPL
ncbi:poly-gamma-glutamate biosynthesis protein PgsC [Thalassoroseus pseudoceratinae]|uniref:poly-gamma-glutamate biosynthesis protein PgsC n=1 Tax=Thalassoroseus pseudoceratinae TaxID=2713176 RepID=UPI001981704E|nr:poly-gamma-glutamate biosynthesis protein PgsC [Thalassoroseus pseudoceratinae]